MFENSALEKGVIKRTERERTRTSDHSCIVSVSETPEGAARRRRIDECIEALFGPGKPAGAGAGTIWS